MRNRLIAAALAAIALATWLGSVPVAEQENTAGTSVRQRQVKELREGGLAAAAAVTGSYIGGALPADLGSPASLRALVSSSEQIVVATVTSNRAYLTRDGHSILTHYAAGVGEVLKGTLSVSSEVSLVVPGGRVGFSDGSWAQLDLGGFIRPSDGESYVLFLRDARTLYRRETAIGMHSYVPMFGPLGVYHLKDDGGLVIPAGNLKSALARSLVRARLTTSSFISEIKALLNQ